MKNPNLKQRGSNYEECNWRSICKWISRGYLIENGKEIQTKNLELYLEKIEVLHLFWFPYHPRSQWVIDVFDKTLQNYFHMHMIVQNNQIEIWK